MRVTRFLRLAIVSGCLTSPIVAQDPPKPAVSLNVNLAPERLLAQPVGENWLSYNGDYTGKRYSSLDQINANNVQGLRTQWVFHAASQDGLEVTPVVVDGMMFVTAANDAYALDGQTGRVVWHYSRPVTEGLVDDAASSFGFCGNSPLLWEAAARPPPAEPE